VAHLLASVRIALLICDDDRWPVNTDWTRWAIVVAVGLPLLWFLSSGALTHTGAWLIVALTAAIGIRAVLRARRFDPDKYRGRRR
jgi:hypothetical protein